jgi:hypothetical protein
MIRRFIIAAIVALAVSTASTATEAVLYVNTDNGGSVDGLTHATGYTSLAALFTAETDTLTQDMVIECAGTTADTAAVTGQMDTGGFTLTIRGDRNEADGFYDGPLEYSTSHYRNEQTSATSNIAINQNNVAVDGIQVLVRNSNFSRGIIVTPVSNSTSYAVRNNRIKGPATATSTRGIYISINKNSSTFVVQNNIVTKFDRANSSGIYVEWASFFNSDAWITGNTVFLATIGIQTDDINDNSSTSNGTIKNNAVANCTTDYSEDPTGAFTITSTHNASDDAFGTSAQDISPGGTESDDWADAWTDPNAAENSRDFNVVASGVLDGNGTTGTGILTTDILGNARDGSTPSIGAFEVVGGGGGGAVPPPGLLTGNGLNAGGLRKR